jgi:uncharacterized membrane protein HdeD (DUF308 family)
MELKSYEKPWLPAFKGAFLIIFGIVAILRITGSINPLAILFTFLIGAMAILLIGTGILVKKAKFRNWSIITGLINLAFAVFLLLQLNSPDRDKILWIIFVWVLFYALTEIIEAGLLFSLKNAFGALFILNALLTLLFGYFFYVLMHNFTRQGVFYIGIIALVFGIANVLSSYLLGRK